MGQSSCKATTAVPNNSSCKGLPCCNYGSNQCRSQDGEIVPVTNSDPCGLYRAAVGTKCTNERNDVLIKLRDAFTPCQTQMSAKFWDNVLAADGFVVDQCFVNSDIDNARTALFEKALYLGCDQEHAVAHCNAKGTLGNYENIFRPSSKTFEDRYSACLLAQGCANVQCSCTGEACSRCVSSYSNLSNSKVSGNEGQLRLLRDEQKTERAEDVSRRKDVEPCFSGLQWSGVVGQQLDGRCVTNFGWDRWAKWKQRCEALATRLGVRFESKEPQNLRVLPFGCIANGMPEYPWDPDTKTFENVAGKGSITEIKFVKWKSGTTSRKVAGTCVDDYGDGEQAGDIVNETNCANNGFRWVPDWYSLCLSGPEDAHGDLGDDSFDSRSWHVLDADANQPHVCEDEYGDVVDKSEAACTGDGKTWVPKAYAVTPNASSLVELGTAEANMAAVLADMEEEKIWPSVQACDARCRTRYPPTEDCVGWKNKALGYCRRGCGVDWDTEATKTCSPSDRTVPDELTREYAAAHLIRAGTNGHAPWREGVFKGPTSVFPASGCGSGDDRVACEYGFGYWRGEAVMAMNTEVSSPTMSPPDCEWEDALEDDCHLKSSSTKRRECFSKRACHNVVCTKKSGQPRVCVPPVAKRPTYPVLKIDVEYTDTNAEELVAGYNETISTCDGWMDDDLFGDYDEATRTKYRDACRNGARMLPLPKEAQTAVLMPAEYSEEDRCGERNVQWVSGGKGQSCDDVCGAHKTTQCSVDRLRNPSATDIGYLEGLGYTEDLNVTYSTLTDKSDFCGDGQNATTEMVWFGEVCDASGNVQWNSMKSLAGTTRADKENGCEWNRAGKSTSWLQTYLGSCGVPATYLLLPTTVDGLQGRPKNFSLKYRFDTSQGGAQQGGGRSGTFSLLNTSQQAWDVVPLRNIRQVAPAAMDAPWDAQKRELVQSKFPDITIDGWKIRHTSASTCDSQLDHVARVCPCTSPGGKDVEKEDTGDQRRRYNLTRHECQSFATQHGMAWEDLTPLYVDAYHKVAAGGSPSYTARGVFEGTEANATAACDDEPTCLNTFSAGNDKWWMVCTERGTETGALCPDAFAPVGSSSCEQLQWSKDAQRDFTPSTAKEECEAQRKYLVRSDATVGECKSMMEDMNAGRVPMPEGLTTLEWGGSESNQPYAGCYTYSAGDGNANENNVGKVFHRNLYGTLTGEELGTRFTRIFAPDALWVEKRQYDPIGCSVNSDGKVVFRSPHVTGHDRQRTVLHTGRKAQADEEKYPESVTLFSDENQRSVCAEQNCTGGDCPAASRQLVSFEDFEAAVAAGITDGESIVHANTRNAMQDQTTNELNDDDGCTCVRHSQGTGRSRVRVECEDAAGTVVSGEWSEWVGYDAAASATAHLDTKQCTIRRAEQCPALILEAGKPDGFHSCEEAGLVTCNGTQCCRVAGDSGYVDTFGQHETQAAARADCEAQGLRLCAKEEVVAGGGVGWVAGGDFPGERTNDDGPWVVALGGTARCDLPYGAHCCRTCSQNEIERNWEKAAYWSS